MRSSKALGVLVVLALVLGLSTTQIGTVSAARPVETTFTLTLVEADVAFGELPSGGWKVTLHRILHEAAGDWVGDWEHSGFAIISPTGTFFAFAFATFTGTILGKAGTVDIVIHTHGTWDFPDGPFEFRFSKVTILSGTDDLANLHGQGTEDETGVHVRIHFNP